MAFGSGPFASQSRVLPPGYHHPLSLITIVNGDPKTVCLGNGWVERKKNVVFLGTS
jgi:hypothetical protein